MEKRKLASIRRVKEIKPIENADAIELAIVDGWQCVTKKGEFQVGDLGVYFEIDSFLPIDDKYEFLRKSSYKKIMNPLAGQREEGFRLKTVKLRGQVSQGMILPLNFFHELQNSDQAFSEGYDLTELLNIDKFDPPLSANLAGVAKGLFPSFIQKTDQERIQNLIEYFSIYKETEFEVTEKVDGTSMTVYLSEGNFGVCSRNLELVDAQDNGLWKMAKELKLEPALRQRNQNIAIQGELIGEGIQKNPLRIKGQQFLVFDIYLIDEHKYASGKDRQTIMQYLQTFGNILHVPIVYPASKVFEEHNDISSLLNFAAGKSFINPNVEREGLVFKAVDGSLSFKVVSNKYLLKMHS